MLRFCFLSMMLTSSCCLWAQHKGNAFPPDRCAQMERAIARSCDSLEEVGYPANYNSAAVTRLNLRIGDVFLKGLNGNAASMAYPFSQLRSRRVHITSSPDGNLRIYSWDIHTGGTMRGESSIIQCRTAHGVYARFLFDAENDRTGEAGYWYQHLYAVPGHGGRIYIGLGVAQYSTKDVGLTAKAFVLDERGLDDSVKLFRDEGKLTNELSIYFDYLASTRAYKARMLYDTASRVLRVPVVDGETLTRRFRTLRFDGRMFQ